MRGGQRGWVRGEGGGREWEREGRLLKGRRGQGGAGGGKAADSNMYICCIETHTICTCVNDRRPHLPTLCPSPAPY